MRPPQTQPGHSGPDVTRVGRVEDGAMRGKQAVKAVKAVKANQLSWPQSMGADVNRKGLIRSTCTIHVLATLVAIIAVLYILFDC